MDKEDPTKTDINIADTSYRQNDSSELDELKTKGLKDKFMD